MAKKKHVTPRDYLRLKVNQAISALSKNECADFCDDLTEGKEITVSIRLSGNKLVGLVSTKD